MKPAARALIRPARPSEAEALGRIALAAKGSWGYTAQQLQAWRAELVPTAASLSARPSVVAEVDDIAVGFCQLALADGRAELAHLWVHPDAMRQGIGRRLLAEAVRQLAQRGIAWLEIDSDPHAAPFYVACGAEAVGCVSAPIAGDPLRTRPQLRLGVSPFDASARS